MKRPLITLMLVVSVVTLSACTSPTGRVEQFGAMRSVMREGHTEPRITLSDAVQQPHAFAVGALAGLAGEITIYDGDVWVAAGGEEGPSITGPELSGDDRATLLTIAHVSEWRTAAITESIADTELESLIENTARSAGIDTSIPFPFLIEGEAAELSIHVINGFCPVAVNPADLGAQPWRWSTEEGETVTIVGFYARDAAGSMTHHGTSIHAHAIFTIQGQTVTGHIDHLRVASGALLKVPHRLD